MSRDLTAARRFCAVIARHLGLAIIEAEEDGFTLGRLNDMSTPALRVTSASHTIADAPEPQPDVVGLEAPGDYTAHAFCRAALEAGDRQVGYSGPQPASGQHAYDAARVEDPNGNCIERGWRH